MSLYIHAALQLCHLWCNAVLWWCNVHGILWCNAGYIVWQVPPHHLVVQLSCSWLMRFDSPWLILDSEQGLFPQGSQILWLSYYSYVWILKVIRYRQILWLGPILWLSHYSYVWVLKAHHSHKVARFYGFHTTVMYAFWRHVLKAPHYLSGTTVTCHSWCNAVFIWYMMMQFIWYMVYGMIWCSALLCNTWYTCIKMQCVWYIYIYIYIYIYYDAMQYCVDIP